MSCSDFEEDAFIEALNDDQPTEAQRPAANLHIQHWILSLSIGLGTGIFGFLLAVMVSGLTSWKWATVFAQTDKGDIGTGYLCLLMFTLPMSIIAAIFVYIEPEAAGSGIPNVKVFLNGAALRGLGALGLKTLFLKCIGVGLCVCCGFPAGREGPMIQTGAILASQMARGFEGNNHEIHINPNGASDAKPSYCQRFLAMLGMDGSLGSHKMHRDFVAMGCAAGVSAAFIAPIGGVLFSIEEVASFWSSELTWRTFVCSAVAATTVRSAPAACRVSVL